MASDARGLVRKYAAVDGGLGFRQETEAAHVAGPEPVSMTTSGAEGADVAESNPLDFPKCQCGEAVCPDGTGGQSRDGDKGPTLRDKLREVNRRSKDGL